MRGPVCCVFFFFNDTATTEIYTLSLHDALPISLKSSWEQDDRSGDFGDGRGRSEEHTSELQSRGLISYAVFCLKKKQKSHSHEGCRTTMAPCGRGALFARL